MSALDDRSQPESEVRGAVREAGSKWAQAMQAHKLAPPDPGFASRLRALSEAATREQAAWAQAHSAGLKWRPIPDAQHAEPPYELRPGTGRRGPVELWEQFDAAVSGLNRAISGSNAAVVAEAFGAMARAAGALAQAVHREDDAGTEPDARRAAAGSPGVA